jgi:hypothetical protein
LDVTGALAHLALKLADALAGDNAKARAAHQDFLAFWKHSTTKFHLAVMIPICANRLL